MTPERLQEIVLASVHSVSGLRALVSLLPEDQHPGPTVRRCKRCEKDYDTRYEDVCRTAHPQGEVYGIDIDSKRAEYGCHACGKSFYVSPFWENDGTYSEKTGWCFEGEHDPEDSEEEDEEEDDEDSEEDRRHRYDDSPRRRRRWW
jgi:transcription elongation factor Elf1